jgi:hypothetical protein
MNCQYAMDCCYKCGTNDLSMSTSDPNPAVCQNVCCDTGCGGASKLSSALNAIGKWGTILTATVQGKPVIASKSGVAVGARGATSVSGNRMSGNSMLLILVIVAVLIFMALRK